MGTHKGTPQNGPLTQYRDAMANEIEIARTILAMAEENCSTSSLYGSAATYREYQEAKERTDRCADAVGGGGSKKRRGGRKLGSEESGS